MKILVDSLPDSREECVLRDSCPEYDICSDPNNCLRLTCVKHKIYLDEKDIIKETIKKLKIMPDLSGHNYIIKAVLIIRECEDRLYIMDVYKAIAVCFGCSYKAVERDIRTAIYRSHYHFDEEAKKLWKSICGTDERVNNNSFLRCLSDYIGLKMSGLIE